MAIHLGPREWGWHARAASSHYLAVEIAQPLEQYAVTDAQVRALCWYLVHEVFPVWPELRGAILANPQQALPTHAEVEVWGLTGAKDGKTDCFSFGSPHADELRRRILARLADRSWSV